MTGVLSGGLFGSDHVWLTAVPVTACVFAERRGGEGGRQTCLLPRPRLHRRYFNPTFLILCHTVTERLCSNRFTGSEKYSDAPDFTPVLSGRYQKSHFK